MSDKPATTLYTALLAAQRAMGPVKKDASNPAFRSKYATLQSILDTIEGPLQDNGLILLQRFQAGEHCPVLWTEIIHAESGHAVSSTVDIIAKDAADPQKMGSAITYYRRYSLLALLGLAPEDDDGNADSKPPQRQQPVSRGFADTQPAPNSANFTNNQPAPAPNGTHPTAPAGVDDLNPHPPGSAEHVLFEARRLASAGHGVPDVWKFLASRQDALKGDWPAVFREWRDEIKPSIERALLPTASHAG